MTKAGGDAGFLLFGGMRDTALLQHHQCRPPRRRRTQYAAAVVGRRAVSGILGRPVPAPPRLRRGFPVLARRSFTSGGGKPGDDSVSSPSIIRLQIIRDSGGLVERIPVVGIAVQQSTRLGLVIRRDVVGLIDRPGENVAVILIRRRRADEDAATTNRLGVQIAHAVGIAVNDERCGGSACSACLPAVSLATCTLKPDDDR